MDTVDSEGDVGAICSLELSSEGNPHISYFDDNNNWLKYAYSNGENWYIRKVDDMAPNLGYGTFGTFQTNDLELDANDRPHISYVGYITTYVYPVKYAYWVDTRDFVKETVYDSGRIMTGNSLDLDSSGNPHISYVEDGMTPDIYDTDLKYAYKGEKCWVNSIIEQYGVHFHGTSIEVDSSNNPRIAYFKIPGYWQLEYAYYIPDKGKSESSPTHPSAFSLGRATPNPMIDTATINFALPYACDVDLTLYDIKGRKVKTLAEGRFNSGDHEVEVSGLSSGLYIYKLETEEFSDTGKLVAK